MNLQNLGLFQQPHSESVFEAPLSDEVIKSSSRMAPRCLFPFLTALVPLRVETRISYLLSVPPPAQVSPSFRRFFLN